MKSKFTVSNYNKTDYNMNKNLKLKRNYCLSVRKVAIVMLLLLSVSIFYSCATTGYETFYVSVVDDLKKTYMGKTKSYIIENFPYSITDIKHLDEQYEILICERYRPLGTARTRFFMKNGICYNIETNEYKAEQRKVKYSFF